MNANASPKFQVIDRHTGAIVRTLTDRRAARRHADKLDNDYGAYRYGVKEITS